MAMAIPITSCLTQAHDKQRFGILTTTFLAPAPLVQLFLLTGTVVGVADFNSDGKPDYALYNSAVQQTAVWYLNNNPFVQRRLWSKPAG